MHDGLAGSQWSVDDVCNWLAYVDLQECVVPFRRAHMDGAALLGINPERLREIGINVCWVDAFMCVYKLDVLFYSNQVSTH